MSYFFSKQGMLTKLFVIERHSCGTACTQTVKMHMCPYIWACQLGIVIAVAD